MNCILKPTQPSTFTVTIGNIKMECPLVQLINDICPLWLSEIQNERNITLDDNLDLNGVRDFFDGIKKGNITITAENCQTIQKLGKSCGSKQIENDAQEIINKYKRSIPELLNELIDENSNQNQNVNNNNDNDNDNENKNDQHEKEMYLSKHYNEALQYKDLLKKVEISQHIRIAQKALSHYQKDEFNYRGFISFVLELIENGYDRKYSMLLSLLEFNDFDINELERLCKCSNFDESFLNFKIVNYLSKLKENDEKIAKQEENIKNLKIHMEEIEKQNIQICDNITSKIIELFTNQQKSIDEVKQQNAQIINDKLVSLDSELKKEIQNIKNEATNQNEVTNNKNQEMIDDQNTKLDSLFTNQQNLINEIKNQINEKFLSLKNELLEKIESLETQNKNQNDEIKKQTINLINDQNTKLEQLFTNQQNLTNENKNQINEKFLSLKNELLEKIESVQTQNKNQDDEIKKQTIDLINDQNTKLEQLFTDQQNLINENKTQTDGKLDSLKNELFGKIESVQTQNKNQDDEIKKQTKDLINDQTSKIQQLFTNQQASINGITQKNKQNIEDEITKLTTVQNNINKEIKDIQTKISNFQSFVDENKGIKNEIIKNQSENKSWQSAQNQKIIEIQNSQKKLKEDIEQIDMYFSGMVLRRDYLGGQFSGIISELTKNCGGNVNDKGVISITGNSYDKSYSFLVDYNDHNSHCFYNVQNSYVCFDFKDHCISLSAYSIQSSSCSPPDYLTSWKVEGSNGENEWIELDSHTNDQALCSKSVIRTFQICKEKKIKQPFRFIRIRITGSSSRNFYCIEIANVEFFGKYYKIK